MRGDVERAHVSPLVGVDRAQRVAGGDPDIGAVIGDPANLGDIRKGAVFADNRGCLSFHGVILGRTVDDINGTRP